MSFSPAAGLRLRQQSLLNLLIGIVLIAVLLVIVTLLSLPKPVSQHRAPGAPITVAIR